MIRLILALCLVLGGSGTVLYMSKQTVDSRYNELRNLKNEISKAEERAAILEAEWAYVTRPDRILSLSDGLLSMRPITADRILPLEAIPMRRAEAQADDTNQTETGQSNSEVTCNERTYISNLILMTTVFNRQPAGHSSGLHAPILNNPEQTAQMRLIFTGRLAMFLFCGHRRKSLSTRHH